MTLAPDRRASAAICRASAKPSTSGISASVITRSNGRCWWMASSSAASAAAALSTAVALHPPADEQFLQDGAVRGVVVHDQHAEFVQVPVGRPRRLARLRLQSEVAMKRNWLPRPSSLVTQIRPPSSPRDRPRSSARGRCRRNGVWWTNRPGRTRRKSATACRPRSRCRCRRS